MIQGYPINSTYLKTIEIRIIPNARKVSVEPEALGKYKVYVQAPAVDGKANKALLDVLAAYFKLRKGCFEIIRGERSRNKIIRINDS